MAQVRVASAAPAQIVPEDGVVLKKITGDRKDKGKVNDTSSFSLSKHVRSSPNRETRWLHRRTVGKAKSG